LTSFENSIKEGIPYALIKSLKFTLEQEENSQKRNTLPALRINAFCKHDNGGGEGRMTPKQEGIVAGKKQKGAEEIPPLCD